MCTVQVAGGVPYILNQIVTVVVINNNSRTQNIVVTVSVKPQDESILHSATLSDHPLEYYTFLLMSAYVMKLGVRTLKNTQDTADRFALVFSWKYSSTLLSFGTRCG